MLHNLVRDLNWLAETESDELRLTVETLFYPSTAHR